MLIMPLFGNVFYESGRLKSLPGKGTGKFPGLADVAACIAAPVGFPLVLGSVLEGGSPRPAFVTVMPSPGYLASGCYGRDKDGPYRDKRQITVGAAVCFQLRRTRGLPESAPHAGRRGRGSLPGLCRVGATAASAAGARTRLAEVLTRSAGRSTFMETFPTLRRSHTKRTGLVPPSPGRTSARWLPDGAAQGLESPSCGKTMICGRTGTTGLPPLRHPGVLVFLSPPEVLGVSGTGRYLTVGR